MIWFFILNQQYTAQFGLIHKHDSNEPLLVMNRSKKIEELTGLNQSNALFNMNSSVNQTESWVN